MTMKRRLALGQSMTEYAIIVALIAISGISAFRYFGGVLQLLTVYV
uniref:Flp pilus assembly protein, pilin Flp n=1 Tax=Rheinheimera sp. BAL341 TaxID=1708203 RepID=A0A486XJJ5_9GAMM